MREECRDLEIAGRALQAAGKHEDAVIAFEKALSMLPAAADQRARVHIGLAESLNHTGGGRQ